MVREETRVHRQAARREEMMAAATEEMTAEMTAEIRIERKDVLADRTVRADSVREEAALLPMQCLLRK